MCGSRPKIKRKVSGSSTKVDRSAIGIWTILRFFFSGVESNSTVTYIDDEDEGQDECEEHTPIA